MPAEIAFKLFFQRKELSIHRIRGSFSWEEFKHTVAQIWGGPAKRLHLSYVDEDGDAVKINTELEWMEAIRLCEGSKKVMKINVSHHNGERGKEAEVDPNSPVCSTVVVERKEIGVETQVEQNSNSCHVQNEVEQQSNVPLRNSGVRRCQKRNKTLQQQQPGTLAQFFSALTQLGRSQHEPQDPADTSSAPPPEERGQKVSEESLQILMGIFPQLTKEHAEKLLKDANGNLHFACHCACEK